MDLQTDGLQTKTLAAEKVEAIWRWSTCNAPWRVAGREMGSEDVPAHREVEPFSVVIATMRDARGERRALPSGLRLIAAPVAMWNEVPEALLPQWPVPESGRMTLPKVPDARWRLRLIGEEYGSPWQDVSRDAKNLEIVVQRATTASMALVGQEGMPLDGARLVLYADEGASGRRPDRLTWFETSKDGSVTLEGIATIGTLGFEARAAGHATRVMVSTMESLPSELRLVRGASVKGRMVNRDDSPLEGVELRIEAWLHAHHARSLTRRAVSDAHGRFAFDALPVGKALLIVDDQRFAPVRVELALADGGTETDAGDLRLAMASRTRLQIVDDTDSFVAGARVRFAGGRQSETGVDGKADLEPVDPGATLAINVQAPGHLPVETMLRPPHDRQHGIVLQRSFRVLGRLVDEANTPVEDGSATLQTARRLRDVELDSGGRFEIDLRPARKSVVCLRSPSTSELCVDIAAGEAGTERDLGDLSVSRGVRAYGSLARRDDGTPVAGARVWSLRPSTGGEIVSWARGDVIETRSLSDGTFTLTGLPQQATEVRIEAAGLARDVISLALPDGEREMDLGRRELSVGSTVVVIADEVADGALARVDAGGRWFEPDMLTASVIEGRATIQHVAAGSAIVSVVAGRELECDERVEIAGTADAVEVVCGESSMTVLGNVLVGTQPVSGGALVWRSSNEGDPPSLIQNFTTQGGLVQQQVFGGGAPSIRVAVDPSGFFVSDGLSAGDWLVSRIGDGSGGTEEIRVRVPEGEVYETVLRFDPLALRGQVIDEAGNRVAGAYVGSTSGGHTFSRDDGSFVLTGLSLGTHRIHARRRDLSSEEVPVVLEADHEPPEMTLTLGDQADQELTVAVRDAGERPVPGALVLLESPRGPLFQVLTADAEGIVRLDLRPPRPQWLRAAAFAGGRWLLGDWAPVSEEAPDLVLAASSEPATIHLLGDSSAGVSLEAPGGWSLDHLLARIGRAPRLAPDVPLTVAGLPPGPYVVGVGTERFAVTVAPGETVDLEAP